MAFGSWFHRTATRAKALLRRDKLRAMRLIFLMSLLVVSVASMAQLAATGLPLIAFGASCVVLAALFGIRVMEYRWVRAVPIWLDAVELAAIFGVLLLTDNIDAMMGTLFFLVLFRAAVSGLARLVPLLIGYAAVWLTAIAVHPQIRFMAGALVSLPVVGLLVWGMRVLMLRLQEQHRAQSALLDAVLHQLPFPVIVTDAAGDVILSNPAASTLTGWSLGTPPSLSTLDIVDRDGQPVDLGVVATTTASGARNDGMELQLRHSDGSASFLTVETVPLPTKLGERNGTVLALLDTTAQRLYEQHLHHAAYHDTLTSLPNRALLWHHFDAAVRTGQRYCLLLVDLDEFKAVNDTYGHQAGDELLQQVAQRLTATAPGNAIVARLGGDEFAVLLPGAGREQAETIAAEIRRAFAEPFGLRCGQLNAGGTIGVAEAMPGQAADAVIAAADSAMYSAKRPSRRLPRARAAHRDTYPATAPA